MIQKTESQNIQNEINNIKRAQNKQYHIPWVRKFADFTTIAALLLFLGVGIEAGIGAFSEIPDLISRAISQAYVAAGVLAASLTGSMVNIVVRLVREKKEFKKLGIKPEQAETEIERLSKQLARVKKLEKAKDSLDKQQIVSKSKSDIDQVKFAEAQQKLSSQINAVVDSMKKAKNKEESDRLFAKFKKLSLEQDALTKSFKSSTR